jgi:hypothetical protein
MIRLALSVPISQSWYTNSRQTGAIDKMSIGIYLFSFFQTNKFFFLSDRSNRWQTEGKIIKIKKALSSVM